MARALYGDPEVVVLDEATSALDPEVAAAIDDAIAALRGRKTLIVIAHRLASMRRCDFVVFMENGCISDLGRLEDLAARNAAFARFAGMRIPTVMPA
jgi:ABC-type multidrug transport system fused ATPase/permease subunit